jgi:D-arabinose 5-phosphate isomerase GutQ
MERKSGESAEIRNLQEKLSQLNQNVAKITDDKVSMVMIF